MQTPITSAPAALAAPFVRLWRLEADDKALGALYGALAFLVDPIFWLGLLILTGFGVWDWVLGTRLAYQRGAYDDVRAQNGVLSKGTGFVLVIGLRLFVEYLRASGIPMPAGATVQVIGASLTGMLIIGEIRSIGRKEAQLGRSSLSPIVQLLDRIIGADRLGAAFSAHGSADNTNKGENDHG